MTKTGINLQDSFLNQVRKENSQIDLILLDGSKLHGQVRGFDNFTVIVQAGVDQHLIYKHAIAQIVHQRGTYKPGGDRDGRHNHRPNDHNRQPTTPPPPRPPRPPEPKSEKDKFNMIDLSDVKSDDKPE
jgi:host factor-I protein